MTIQHMTSAEFRALHGTSSATPVNPKKSKTVRGPWHTRCRTCGEESYTEAAQERHCFNPGHRVYEVVAALSNNLSPTTPKEG